MNDQMDLKALVDEITALKAEYTPLLFDVMYIAVKYDCLSFNFDTNNFRWLGNHCDATGFRDFYHKRGTVEAIVRRHLRVFYIRPHVDQYIIDVKYNGVVYNFRVSFAGRLIISSVKISDQNGSRMYELLNIDDHTHLNRCTVVGKTRTDNLIKTPIQID